MSKPLMRAAIVMLTTDNTAKLIPIDNVWAEGEATVQLPDWIGGFGGYGEAVFNTYTQDMGLEGEANYMVLMLAGSFYLARSERLNIPFLDSFEVAFEADALAAGLGIPPAPAQVLEIQGVSAGINDLTDFIDYNPFVDTIPSVELTFSASFRLVEVINFQASVWVQLLSGGINVTGGVGLGPIQIEVLKELSFELGVQDGPFETYDEADQNFFVKGKRSLLFFVNAKFHASLMGIVHGAGGFSISMTVSPALWEKQGGFDSVDELVKFLAFNVSVNGYLMASINFPMTDFQIMDADVILDIVFEPGADLDFAPLGFKKFKFEATERVLGIKVSESSFDLLAMYPGLKYWVQQQVAAAKEKLNDLRDDVEENLQASVQEATVQALNTFLAAPESTGLEPDPNYKGETKLLNFGETVADSSERTETGGENIVQSRNGAMTRGIMRMAIAQDNTNIRVESDGKTYTHRITVPNDTNDYILQLEDYGDSDSLAFADISVVKPNGQALTIREVAKNVTAEQANSGYNAAIVDGVLMLRLSDYGNTTDGLDITTDYTTLSGEWQVTSPKAFKSKLVKITPEASVTSVKMNGSTVEVVFENLDQGLDGGESYYYDLVLERKSSPDEAPIETFPLVKNEKLENSTMSFDLAQEDLELSDKLPTGDWYPHVTLRKGKVEAYEMNDVNASTLITEYVVDKVSDMVYQNVNTALSGVTWNAGFTAVAAGNQSIALTWNKAVGTDPDPNIDGDLGMAVRGYYIAVYDAATGALGSRTVMGEDGTQSVRMMEYSVQPEERDTYSYSLADIPTGSYKVGITPLYADWVTTLEPSEDDPDVKEEKTTLSPVTRQGTEVMSGTVTIAQAAPPTLRLRINGKGSIDETSGYTMIFAGSDATLVTETSDGANVSIMEYDGTPVVFSGTNTLADYAGETLMIQAENAAKDTTTMIASVYAAPNAPLLLPDNYVTLSDDEDEAGERGEFLFIADYTTGAYEITGQTEPGQSINGTVSDDNGLFSISGTLSEGTDEEFVTLVVTNIVGMVTMREVRIERGPDTESDEDIATAKTAIENVAYQVTQAALNAGADTPFENAKDYVQSTIDDMAEVKDNSVIADISWGSYTGAIAGTAASPEGTNGGMTFTVTLQKGGGTPVAIENLSLSIIAIPYDVDPDNVDITTARLLIEGARYQDSQLNLQDQEAALNKINDILSGLSLNGVTAVVVTGEEDYSAPIAGTAQSQAGVNGSLTFQVRLNKGGGDEQITNDLTLTITATPYDPDRDNEDIATAKAAIEGAAYTAQQSEITDEAAAKAYVQSIVAGTLSANQIRGLIATYHFGTYTPPIAGSVSDLDGTSGSLTFTVTLNKGGGTQQISESRTLIITAAPYQPTVITANDGSVQVTYIGEGSDIQLLLPDDKIQELLNQARDNSVIFNLSANDEISQVSMPESAIQDFFDAGMGIEMELADGFITLSNEALSTLAGNGTEVTFQAEQKQIASLSAVQQAAIEPGDVIFDIAVLLDNQPIHLFNGEITLALPYTGATPASAWYLSDNGQLEKMYGTYDEFNQLFYFTPPHLSIYLVGSEESNDDGIRLSNIYIPTTEKGAEILSAKVAVYEDGILSDGSAARLYLTGISSQIKAQAEKEADSRGLQLPFAMAAVHGVGVATGKAMTVSFNLMNVVAGDKITVLQLLQDGTWEALEPIQVGNGTVKVTIKTDSVVAFARTSKSNIPRSPNNGDMNNWIQWAIVWLLLITGSALIALGGINTKRNKQKIH
jgi:hypothetical protein